MTFLFFEVSTAGASGMKTVEMAHSGNQVRYGLRDAIAAEYRKGRLLMIGTTNLDAQREMVWSVGGIAASGHPRVVELARDIMIASAAIPAAFPPVMIDVEVDGQHYQEMHVDGGTVTQVFLYPPSLKMISARPGPNTDEHGKPRMMTLKRVALAFGPESEKRSRKG